jgi:hypothetical protein
MRIDYDNVRTMGHEPVLTIRDPITSNIVHIIGVSHGSPISAALVKDVILKVKPSVVVLELCDERYMALSLESKIRPRGNVTWEAFYDKKLAVMEQTKANQTHKNTILSYAKFIKNQGPLVGSFISMGLLVSGLQKMFKDIPDEFTTAMKVSEELDVPIRLGDAPQTETLNNIKRLVTSETFNPFIVWRDARSLLFSAFGIPAEDLYPRSELNSVIEKKEWISIPDVYIKKKSMAYSLVPLFAIMLISFGLSVLPGNSIADTTMTTQSIQSIPFLDQFPIIQPFQTQLVSTINKVNELFTILISAQIPPALQNSINIGADIFALLLLVRLGKLIGADRDRILAGNIQKVCQEFPVSCTLYKL